MGRAAAAKATAAVLLVAALAALAVLAGLAVEAQRNARAYVASMTSLRGMRCMSTDRADLVLCQDALALPRDWGTGRVVSARALASLMLRYEMGLIYNEPALYGADALPGASEVAVLVGRLAKAPSALVVAVPLPGGGLRAIALFRGTVDAYDWAQNLRVGQATPDGFAALGAPGVGAHRGFLAEYGLVEKELKAWLARADVRALTVAGHSMGCGPAAILALEARLRRPDLPIDGALFASPRVGNAEFSRRLRATTDVATYVNTADSVPFLIPVLLPAGLLRCEVNDFAHAGRVVAFTDRATTSSGAHSLFSYWRATPA